MLRTHVTPSGVFLYATALRGKWGSSGFNYDRPPSPSSAPTQEVPFEVKTKSEPISRHNIRAPTLNTPGSGRREAGRLYTRISGMGYPGRLPLGRPLGGGLLMGRGPTYRHSPRLLHKESSAPMPGRGKRGPAAPGLAASACPRGHASRTSRLPTRDAYAPRDSQRTGPRGRPDAESERPPATRHPYRRQSMYRL